MWNYYERIFGQDPQRQRQNEGEISSHNKQVIKEMIKYSPQSSIMFIFILVMLLVCVITDIVTNRFRIERISGLTLIKYGANSSYYVNQQHQYYRLITAMFLHAGFVHLMMNSISFLLYLMPVQRKLLNHKIFFTALIFGGILGNCLSISIGILIGRNVLAVGASTSICSIIGLDMSYRALKVDNMPFQIKRMFITLGYIFVISMLPGVDFWGHFGSLIGGFLIGAAFLHPGSLYYSIKRRKFINLLGLIFLIAYTALLIVPIIMQ